MKTFLSYACIAVVMITASCTQHELTTVNTPEVKRPPILKTLALTDPATSAYLELQIANEALLHLTEDDVTISAHTIDNHTAEMINDESAALQDTINEGVWEDADFYIDDVRLPATLNALNIKIDLDVDSVGERGCKDPVVFEANGRCRVAEPEVWGRTIGFYGSPKNCNHTDWEWKRKRWWGYKKLYDRDSYNSNTVIGYSSTNHYESYQLRIDPNNRCCFTPRIVDFNFVYGYSRNSSCR